ncbi:MAG TPA: hypothetical protein VGK73_39970 [Polyangiaceae bacterium]
MLLLAASAASSSGCLVAEVPEYAGPQQTPPFIQSSSINPSPYELIQVHEGDPPKSFSFRVHSEDNNEKLWIAFFRDYGLVEGEEPIEDQSRPPSTLDKPHNLTISVPLNKAPDGCHQLTMLVMHESTWDNVADAPIPEKALTDMSSVTWWMNVRADLNDPNTLVDCPAAGQPSETTQ